MTGSSVVTLRPAELEDMEKVFQWYIMLPGNQLYMWGDFLLDNPEWYFTGAQPLEGRSFIIMRDGKKVGIMSYAVAKDRENAAEIRGWKNPATGDTDEIRSVKVVNLFCKMLQEDYKIKEVIARPSLLEETAVKIFEDSGFKIVESEVKKEKEDEKFGERRSGDCLLMIRKMEE